MPTISLIPRIVILRHIQCWLILLKLICFLEQLRDRNLQKILQSKCISDLLLLIEVVQNVVLGVALELGHVCLEEDTQDLFRWRHIGSDLRACEVAVEAQDIEAFKLA